MSLPPPLDEWVERPLAELRRSDSKGSGEGCLTGLVVMILAIVGPVVLLALVLS